MMQNDFNRALSVGLFFTALLNVSQPAAFAGFGNLFGGANGDSTAASPTDATGPKPPPSGDFTTSCPEGSPHRFSVCVANARKNIEKGERMMESCGNDHNKAEYKKGKVMKEIGEKDLAALKLDSRYTSESSLDSSLERKPSVKTEQNNAK